jgi:RHS repeat-associated protein
VGKPYGETRYTWGTTPTDRRFTGQRSEEASLGSLYDYGARFYSPYLNRWIQPDTIVPQPGNPQDLNRFSYARNNPIRYTDPTGHYVYEEDCQDPTDHGFSTGPYTHADTYFFPPTTAIYSRGVAGDPVQVVSIPAQRVSMATVNDPSGFGGAMAGLYALAPSSVRGGILPGGGASLRVPASLLNDVFPEPASSGVSQEQSAQSYVRWLQRGNPNAHADTEHGPGANVQAQVEVDGKPKATAFTSWTEMATSIQKTLNLNRLQIQSLANRGKGGIAPLSVEGPSANYTGWSGAGSMTPGQAPVLTVIWYDGAGRWGLYTAYPHAR